MAVVLNGALRVLYRGSLASCNYDCAYCQFAKRKDNAAALERDRAELARFVAWAAGAARPLAILFTPWGEALVRRHYMQALAELSHMVHVEQVAVQTNLSAPLRGLADCDPERLALWCTYHPSQVRREVFLEQCRRLYEGGFRFSIGMVGNRADLSEAEALRAALPADVYLWINVNRAEQAHYSAEDLARWRAIDALFDLNCVRYDSLGQACEAGSVSISVAGDGTVRRCHFVAQPLGNLYRGGFEAEHGPCPNAVCDCHIGYMNLPSLRLGELFGPGLLARIPAPFFYRTPKNLSVSSMAGMAMGDE